MGERILNIGKLPAENPASYKRVHQVSRQTETIAPFYAPEDPAEREKLLDAITGSREPRKFEEMDLSIQEEIKRQIG